MTRTFAAATLVALLALAGCGSSKKPLSKPDFQAQVNAICKDFNGKIKAIGSPSSLADLPAYVAKAKKLQTAQTSKLKALQSRVPSDFKSDYATALSDLGQELTFAEQLATAAKAKDQAKIAALEKQGDALSKRDDALAVKLGVAECAKN